MRHKKTTLPKKIYCTENKHGQNPIWVKCRSATQKSTLPHYFTVPNTDRTQLIPRISVSLWKTVRKKPKELQVRLNKKNLSAKRKLLQENVFRPLTVKITDEYETQTDNSDSPSENKRTKFTNTRHINPWLKILKHSQQQLKSKDFLWCVENNQPLWMRITNVHCLKDISNSQIYYRFKRGEQKIVTNFLWT